MKDVSYWSRRDPDFYEHWPVGEDGEKEQAVLLTDLQDTGGLADMTVGLLESCGIPCLKQYEEESTLGKVVLGFSGFGVSLYVPQSRLAEAKELLAAPAAETTEEDAQ